VSEPTTMVGSTSFSRGARISVIPCFAVQPIAAPCLGCQQNSFWNGQQTEVDSPIMVKTVHLTSLAASLLATCSSTVRGSTVQWPLFTFHKFQHRYFTIPVFSQEVQPAAGSCLSFSLQVGDCSFVARYCTVPLLIHLLLVVCALYHHYFFNCMSTTYLYCCTALQSLPLLLRSILLQVLLLFPLFGALSRHLS
jgi:hypothetical protein